MELEDAIFNPVTVITKLRALPTLPPALVADLTPRIIMKPKITLTGLLDILVQCGATAEDVFVLRSALETPASGAVVPQVAAQPAPQEAEVRTPS